MQQIPLSASINAPAYRKEMKDSEIRNTEIEHLKVRNKEIEQSDERERQGSDAKWAAH